MKNILCFLAIGCIVLAACSSRDQAPITPTLQPTATAVLVLPTPSSPDDVVAWGNLQVSMDGPEFTDVYETDYGSTRVPTQRRQVPVGVYWIKKYRPGGNSHPGSGKL